MSAISQLVGVLRQTSGPTVATASAGITAAIVGATSAVTAMAPVVVTDYVAAAAVMGMRHDLVRHVFSARAEQLFQSNDGGDNQSYFTDEESFASDGGDRAQRQRQQGCSLEGQSHHQGAENLLGFLCETIRQSSLNNEQR